ncbi:hypothetical protein C8Q69DRAFT_498392 [Paecilomyces variotii]|uniref:Uncharacterized protein n=1 Tax=Byssochlamys spectabilis TaxID=264951 RepID=A0A443HUT9_BYSSP|nr:hypothetical protein C8Q69DRAFT_498392 [Paecilomyces variotii]RWQ95587.1 hypothetical protein C8Q69DRAFT_498392 [Paecilomyces variotii]
MTFTCDRWCQLWYTLIMVTLETGCDSVRLVRLKGIGGWPRRRSDATAPPFFLYDTTGQIRVILLGTITTESIAAAVSKDNHGAHRSKPYLPDHVGCIFNTRSSDLARLSRQFSPRLMKSYLLCVQRRSHVCPRAGLILPGTETGPPETAVSLPAMNDDTARGNNCIIDTLFTDHGLEKHPNPTVHTRIYGPPSSQPEVSVERLPELGTLKIFRTIVEEINTRNSLHNIK